MNKRIKKKVKEIKGKVGRSLSIKLFKNKNKIIELNDEIKELKNEREKLYDLYHVTLSENRKFKLDNNELMSAIKSQIDIDNDYKSKIKWLNLKVKNLEDKVEEKEEARKRNACKIGGLTKENNKLKNELESLQNEFSEFKKNKFVLKKISPGRPNKPAKIKAIRPVSNNVLNFMKEKHDYEVNNGE